MENSQHIKSLNWRGESTGGKNRIRFASVRERSKLATADVYRSYKRRGGPSSATREERVHALEVKSSQQKKKQRIANDRSTKIPEIKVSDRKEIEEDNSEIDNNESIFASELDLAHDRNASEEFSIFYREIWHRTRSFPELLHHKESIITSLISHMLTLKTSPSEINDSKNNSSGNDFNTISGHIVNQATTDILHLLGVLARDLRHELHPFFYTQILPRIIVDLLNPPTSQIWLKHNNIQGYTVDVQIVEMAFRTLSYCFRYNSKMLLNDTKLNYELHKDGDENNNAQKKVEKNGEKNGDNMCLEQMRQFYGATLAHKRECVRKLAAESFAPLIQKLKSKEKKKHLKRVIRALAIACNDNSSNDTNMGKIHTSSQVQRARTDALDGVSYLFFCLCKGIGGFLHSKAHVYLETILDCILSPGKTPENHDGINQTQKQTTITSLASQLLLRLCQHVNAVNFSPIWDELHKAWDASMQTTSKLNTEYDTEELNTRATYTRASNAIGHIAQLLNECISFKDGVLCHQNHSFSLDRLTSSLQKCFETGCYWKIPSYSSNHYFLQKSILQLLCTTWRAHPNEHAFASKITNLIPLIIDAGYADNENKSSLSKTCSNDNFDKTGAPLDPALLLGKELLPYLPRRLIMQTLAPAILAAAIRQVEVAGDRDRALVLLHLVATSQPVSTKEAVEENNKDGHENCYTLFSLSYAKDCIIPQSQRDALLDLCFSYSLGEMKSRTTDTKRYYAQLGFAIRCVPFLTFVGCSRDKSQKKGSTSVQKKVLKWCASVIKHLDQNVCKDSNKDGTKALLKSDKDQCIILKALFIEALSITSIESLTQQSYSDGSEHSCGKTYLKNCQKSAYNFLIDNSNSVWALKSLSTYIYAMKQASLPSIEELSPKPDEIFDTLNKNLQAKSHVIRLFTLKILNSLKTKVFVTDHADIDFADDLDEEPSNFHRASTEEFNANVNNNMNKKSSVSSFSGPCDLIPILFIIESLPKTLENERTLISQLNRAEVLVRSGKLPVVYIEAVANFMFSVLSMKFSPLWPAAIRALVELAASPLADNETGLLWSPLFTQLEEVTTKDMQHHSLPTQEGARTEKIGSDADFLIDSNHIDEYDHNLSDIIKRHEMSCMEWQDSLGLDRKIFNMYQIDKGPIDTRYLNTDDFTYFQLIWSIMEKLPNLTVKKSRLIVQLFLEFLYHQYYGQDSEEPDAKELCFTDNFDFTSKTRSWSGTKLGKKSNNHKLSSFLKTFAEVNGPQQLYKHKFLEKIFVILLSNSEISIAQLSLSCLMKYKRSFLLPYSKSLSRMLTRGELRETLTKFDTSRDKGTIDSHHRSQLLPIISRILFGRLTARGMGTKSSKDTPAARRGAILSFLSGLEHNNNELDAFVYFMVRVFIPSKMNMNIGDLEHSGGYYESNEKRSYLIDATKAISEEEVSKLSVNKIVGFLNVLMDAISKIGYGMNKFIPLFYSILITLCHFSEVKDDNELIPEDAFENKIDTRISSVRALCYKSLSRLFVQFPSYDFSDQCDKLWIHLNSAIQKLPASCTNAEKSPNLLSLLENISSHPNLIPMLSKYDQAVESVICCISANSKYHILDASLRFIENLLSEGGTFDVSINDDFDVNKRVGIQIIIPHIHLLIGQFTKRIGSNGDNNPVFGDNNFGKGKAKAIMIQKSKIARRELSTLCMISNILVHDDLENTDMSTTSTKTLENLCSLLLSFLKLDRGADELIQMSVLGALKSFIPRITSATALSYFVPLSKLLGPNKSTSGITSPQIRQLIVSVIETLSSNSNVQMCYKEVAILLKDLNATDSRYVMEHNFEKIVPALNQLANTNDETGSWHQLAMVKPCLLEKLDENSIEHERKSFDVNVGFDGNPKALIPLVYHCLHSLYDSDGVINRGSFKALKACINTAGVCAKKPTADQEQSLEETRHDEWLNLIEKTLVPNISSCLTTNDESVRKYLILLVSEISRTFFHLERPNLYKDLNFLARDDDPEQDFFLNITHLQIHRRCKALSVLRKNLLAQTTNSKSFMHQFSQHSLLNVMLRIALHPIFESSKPSEESYVLEAVATIGSIAKRITWRKYYALLLSLLSKLSRKPNQERYLIAAICSIIDAFHFDIILGEEILYSDEQKEDFEIPNEEGLMHEDGEVNENCGNATWRALNKSIIPQLESNLVKEVIQRDNSRLKVLRPPFVLALTKLIQKLPTNIFQMKLPRLLIMTCDTLKSRDSNVRDMSRNTLAKIAVCLGFEYLPHIVHQLAVSLSNGYQLHVRSKTLHTVLNSLYRQFELNDGSLFDHFDKCVPALMDLLQQDLFGVASEMKEARDVQRRVIKEAVGEKSYETIEIICKMINLRTLNSMEGSDENASSVHIVVQPLLERLQFPDVDVITTGKLRECLNRVVIGISHNKSGEARHLMPFIYGCIFPLLNVDDQLSDDDYDSENEQDQSIKVSGGNLRPIHRQDKKKQSVICWTPSSLNAATDMKAAQSMKKMQKKELHKVLDGANAPKLTGRSRYGATLISQKINDPSKSNGVSFGLSLLHSCLKRTKLDYSNDEVVRLADPFIWILSKCMKICASNEIILLAIKCLCFLLRWDLPSVHKCKEKLGSYTLLQLTTSGSASNTRHEMTQGCFKILTLLIKSTKHSKIANPDSNVNVNDENNYAKEEHRQPLNSEQMESLISLLHSTVTDSEHQNATFGLIKAIVSTYYESAELYDLMEKILKLTVQSQKESVREQTSMIFIQFLFGYRMGKKRFEDHLKQIVLNIKYEYEDGRLSAIKLLTVVVEKLDAAILEQKTQLFFLPLCLQLVNDDSEKCREAVAKSITTIFQLVSIEILQTLHDYIVRWLNDNQSGESGIQRAAAQLLGILVESRPDFMQRNNNANDKIILLQKLLEMQVKATEGDKLLYESDWELGYFCLICFEKINQRFPKVMVHQKNIWKVVIKCLIHPHSWIKLVASRVINTHLSGFDPVDLSSKNGCSAKPFLCDLPGTLFVIARNVCEQIDEPCEQVSENLSLFAVKILTWAVQAMHSNPDLRVESIDGFSGVDDEGVRDPLSSTINRLSSMAKGKGDFRRINVFKCFASFCATCETEMIISYLELMLVPLHRALTEAENMMSQKQHQDDPDSNSLDLFRDVMQLLEDKCGTEKFISVYSSVKTRAKEKREHRKREAASEAIRNPEIAAKRKIKKQERERERKKRRMQEKKMGVYKWKKRRS